MKIYFLVILILFSAFIAKSQVETEFKNSISLFSTYPLSIKNKFYSSTLEYTIFLNRTIYKQIDLNLSYSFWGFNQYHGPQMTDHNPTPQPGDIYYRREYKFLEMGTEFKFLDFDLLRISLNPQLSFVWGTNKRVVYLVGSPPHIIFLGYLIKESKLGFAIKAKADFKIKKDRFNVGLNGGYRYYPHYNYNSSKGYFQLNLGIHAGINF